MSAAERVIAICGGVKRTAELAEATENWVTRWTYPVDRGGTGGRVPAKAQERLMRAAAEGLVALSPADFFNVFSPEAAE